MLYYDVVGEFCFCAYNARECMNEKGMSSVCKHVLAVRLAEAMEE